MRILSSLRGFTADCSGKNGTVTVNIAGSGGGRLFEILHCCEPVNIKGFENPLYISTEYSSGFIAETVSWEQVLNDGIALYYRSTDSKWTEFAEEELA